MASYEDVFNESLRYFGGDELAANVFTFKYALTDAQGDYKETTPDDMHHRLADEFHRIECQYSNPLSRDDIYQLFRGFRYVVPQGSPMSGIGNQYQLQSLSNCFVLESPRDSYGGILKTDQELVQIAKRRGGVGFDISSIRPKGLKTANAARTTDGIEVFMDRFSNSCREVAQNGRRGALMITISVHHPQIRDFIKIKRDLLRVTGANISIRLTDEFMESVKNDTDVELRFPVDEISNPLISEKIEARELWSEIVESAHECAEPGLIFWDNVRNFSPADLYEPEGFQTISTNPCGEIVLSAYDSCRLLLINLFSFVDAPFTKDAKFDFDKMSEVVQKAQRLMDDLVDLEIEQIGKILKKIENDPESDEVKEIEKNLWLNIETQAQLGRRTGLGVTAVGDTLAGLGVQYGSDNSIKIVEKIYKCLAINAYRSSCILAQERGSFPIHDPTREENHPFLKRIWDEEPELLEMNRKSGRRNIALTTTAPAGSVSTLTQTTSGIEPAYLLNYTRRRKVSSEEDFDFVDSVGDKWQEYNVYHHKFKMWMDVTSKADVKKSPYFQSCSNDVDWIQKIKMQSAAQKWVCHAISNTTNVPEHTTVDAIKEIYFSGWELGCKGVTVYRDKSRTGVLVSSEDSKKFKAHSALPRPRELDCDIHHASIKGEAWTILVGLMDDQPYEVMGGLQKYIEIPRKYKSGTIIKHPYKTKNSRYDLQIGKNGEEVLIKDIVDIFDNPNHAGYTRIISLALRHGALINYVVEQMHKDKDSDLFSFSKVISRVLKNYIKDGTRANGEKVCPACNSENSMIYLEGCMSCINCGWSKCG